MKPAVLPWLALVCVALLTQPLMATELSGTVYSKGAPVANLTIEVKGTALRTKTGPGGEYRLDLSPGEHVLLVRGREFPVSIGSAPARLDIQL
jgi:hypothetical protein